MRYFIDPFGCAKNQVDAEMMAACLNESGWSSSADPDGADLIIVNSCGFIEAAKQESINAVLLWRKRYPGKKILLAGCLAQRYGKELAESLPEADGFFGNDNLECIAEACLKLEGGVNKGSGGLPVSKAAGRRPLLGFPGSAYVKISEGCDNNCSFCAIPFIRGPLRCRSIEDIVEECKQLLERGIVELCLVGQDIAAYRPGLGRLLSAIAELPGPFWVRLLYLHPDHFPLDILELIADDSRFLPYFDIPFQHASPEILAAMNRRGNGETYLKLLETIRGRLPGAVIRSTFLAGFPGETEKDFRRLLDFQERARLDWLGVFTWSAEEGTPAYRMKHRVSEKLAGKRRAAIEKKQIPITGERMNRFTGLEAEVLVEKKTGASGKDGEEHRYLGRLFCHAPEVDGAALIRTETALKPGGLVPCRVIRRAGFDLEVRV